MLTLLKLVPRGVWYALAAVAFVLAAYGAGWMSRNADFSDYKREQALLVEQAAAAAKQQQAAEALRSKRIVEGWAAGMVAMRTDHDARIRTWRLRLDAAHRDQLPAAPGPPAGDHGTPGDDELPEHVRDGASLLAAAAEDLRSARATALRLLACQQYVRELYESRQ